MMKKFLLFGAAMLLAIAIITPSCAKDDDDEPTVTGVSITGHIKNVTDIQVIGATVNFVTPSGIKSAITDANGDYTITGIPAGTYPVNIEATGYNAFSETNVVVAEGSTHEFLLEGSASIDGKVLNSQTAEGVPNVEIFFYDADNKSAEEGERLVFKLMSDDAGLYYFQKLPIGNYIVKMVAIGFFENTISGVKLETGNNNIGEAVIVEEIVDGQVRIVLSWGEMPYDLDTHITGPTTSGNRFHIYYIDEWVNEGTVANLDVDDTDSWGPETITIENYMDGVYRYSIHNYSEQSAEGGQGIYNSPAKVEIFDASGLVGTYSPKPFEAGSGNTWRVFEFTVANDLVNITVLDDYVYVPDEDDGNSFGAVGSKENHHMSGELF